jgi:hypothetical protein
MRTRRCALFFLEARVVGGDAPFPRVAASVDLAFLLDRESPNYSPSR